MSKISIIPSCKIFDTTYSLKDYKEQAKIVENLIRYGIDVNKQYNRGETLLFQAASKGNTYATEILLKNNADPNIPGEYGSYPLYEAVNNNYEDLSLLLLSNGAKVIKTSGRRLPILHVAAHFGLERLIKPLINAGADINEISDFLFPKATALTVANIRNNVKFVNELLSEGASFSNNVVDIRSRMVK